MHGRAGERGSLRSASAGSSPTSARGTAGRLGRGRLEVDSRSTRAHRRLLPPDAARLVPAGRRDGRAARQRVGGSGSLEGSDVSPGPSLSLVAVSTDRARGRACAGRRGPWAARIARQLVRQAVRVPQLWTTCYDDLSDVQRQAALAVEQHRTGMSSVHGPVQHHESGEYIPSGMARTYRPIGLVFRMLWWCSCDRRLVLDSLHLPRDGLARLGSLRSCRLRRC